ncbi:MAG TPA: sugar phosphate isomerase/epimerase family protein [Gemmataceae bacterium]|nr:sugar phosphate isomerase/epimerase family protein [Gemmataceae bacterium]
MKLGVTLESLGLPFRRGLAEVRRLGLAGIQVDAVGELSPDRLTDTGKRELRHLLRSNGLELTALGCPLRHGLDEPENLQPRIDRVRQVMSLSFELGARITIVQAGRISDAADDPRMPFLRESLLALGQHGDRTGATLALETGLESGESLKTFFDTLDTGGLGVNYDPANLLMNGFDPVENLAPLKDRIVHTHAKDARRARVSRAAMEAPLGGGDIDWMQYLGTLGALEYRGWVVIERETGTDRIADVAAGVAFLRRLV